MKELRIHTLSELKGAQILRSPTVKVKYPIDYKNFIDFMVKIAEAHQPHCLALSANQVWTGDLDNIPSVFIVNMYGVEALKITKEQPWMAFFNTSAKLSGPNIKGLEGCMSFPGRKPKLKKRKKNITLTFQTMDGKWNTLKFTGLLARAMQHELDHLRGKLLWKI